MGSPQPFNHHRKKLSMDYVPKPLEKLDSEPEVQILKDGTDHVILSPTLKVQNQLSFSKMVKNTPKRKPKNEKEDDNIIMSPYSDLANQNPFSGGRERGRKSSLKGSPYRYEPFRDSCGDDKVPKEHIDIR